MKKRISLLLFASILISTLLTGCADDIQPANDTTATATTTAPQATEAPQENAAPTTEEILGFSAEDNGRRTFTILTNSTSAYEFNVKSETGDIVDDAVFKKESMVEEYLGIEIELIHESGLWKTRAAFNAKNTNAYATGDDTYDLVNNMLVCTLPLAQQGVFVNVNELQYTNFDQPWYITDMTENYGIKGKLYGILSDHSLSLYKDLSVIFFNATIFENQKSDVNLYDLVRKNEWTLDKFIELTSDMASDLNGDGQYDIDNDLLAYFGEAVPNGTWMTSMDIDIIDLNSDGTYTYHGLSDRLTDLYTKLANYRKSVPGIIDHDSNGKTPGHFPPRETFAEGKVAMMSNHIYTTEYIRDMENDYGIIPIPKYDQTQENYISQVGTSTSTLFIPQNQDDLDLIAKFIECEAYFGYTKVSPIYYEAALKARYANDPNISEMLDIVRQNATIDFLFVYSTSLSSSPYMLLRDFSNPKTNLASWFTTNKRMFISSVDKLIAAYESLE